MGCDIHLYVEYSREGQYYANFGGCFNPGRNYWLFGLLSKGVRCEFLESLIAKGLPENLAYITRQDSRLLLLSDDNQAEEWEGWCSKSDAEEYVKHGEKLLVKDGKPFAVTHPDWHSHSWVTVDEFEKVLFHYNKMTEATIEPEYEAILAASKCLIDFGYIVRIVYWFDN